MAEFDDFAADYQQALRRGLDVTGESPEYFSRRRVTLVAERIGVHPVRRILDFGCGTGGSLRHLLEQFPDSHVTGVDPSAASLDEARRRMEPARVTLGQELREIDGPFDLIFCNGVFHHIVPDERADILKSLRGLLSETGRFAFWENNPWNPGTRLVMSRIPFDRDAVTLSVREARRLLERSGFNVRTIESSFWFPRALSLLRPLEHALRHVPLGGQYWCDCEKRAA